MKLRFIDTNVFLRHFLIDDEEKAQAARSLLLRIEAGAEQVTTSPLVLFELVFILHRVYKQLKDKVAPLVSGVLDYRGLQLAGKDVWRSAFEIWLTHPIDFADAFNVASMRAHGIKEIYAWDRGYGQVSGITRIEPVEAEATEAA
jgi:predicted nucleic acid-binding protein